ncbi:hypothetical protein M408DRAFT_291249 [Serendipita vermifera MAFF 305830]|uniref:PNPLA domain-containing protein n=1 Tax=Serendipita vermifera MAFF 305830 TaxID=933852 RepID=A0A0C2W799_SERVB|nr:hypothetical protein M408DRAFT_291249 [Serendipita vermifera MAFF 305830]
MSEANEKTDGICILSFDSGGPGTYSQVLILKEYMARLSSDLHVAEDEVYPADYFDLMGGVGFGGCVYAVTQSGLSHAPLDSSPSYLDI